MLRSKGWKNRGRPYVCAVCRHGSITQQPFAIRRLSTSHSYSAINQVQAPRAQHSQRRWLSTTPQLRDDDASSKPAPGGPKFPGAFGGAARGTFGTFATNANRAPTASPTNDGLLPHERAARQRATTSAEDVAPKEANSSKPARNNKPNRGNNNNQRAARSKSVLGDVLSSMNEPRKPAAPASNSAGHGKPANTRSNAGNKQSGHIDAHKRPERRKPSIWNDLTRQNRENKTPHAAATSTTQTKKPPTGKDFWNELDSRLKPKQTEANATPKTRFKARNPKGAATTKQASYEDSWTPQSAGAGAVSTKQDSGPGKAKKKSRFEGEDEEPEYRKSRKPQNRNNNRYVEDEDWDDEAVLRWEQKQRRKAEKEAKKLQAVEEAGPVPIFLPEFISAANLASAVKQRAESFLADLEQMGFENVTNDTIMTGETAALIAMEYGFDPTVDSGSKRDLRPAPVPEDVSSLPSRPPVVTIMGHVDHGKTTLLDWLRKSSVAAQEHGGITQHIGAFIVQMSSGKQITFLDTPGHAAFLSMRQRGANVTDIVVLVVAADDSVMPQTIEALKHATAAKVPIIVAINKIDKEDARVDQVKADLSRHGVEIEDYGGDVQVVCVSGKTGQGMNDLEENIVTLSEVLDVRAESDGLAEGWILESSIKQYGKAATVLVKRGTLRTGDFVAAGKTWARVRVLRNEAGIEIHEAPPGTPVEILGWRDLPEAGEMVLQAPDEGVAKTAVEYRIEMAEREESSAQLAEQEQRQRDKIAADLAAAETEETATNPDAGPSILTQNFTVKADVAGSVEAVCASIQELGNNEVQSKILRSGAGQITEYDIDHAAASNSIIVNFNNPVLPHIKLRAEEAKVKILDHTVIYHVVDDAKAALSDILPFNVTVRVQGEADILQVFPINLKKRVFRNIAGCRVRNGSIKRGSLVKVLRKGKVVFQGKIDTLKHVKKDVMEMGKGTECGIGLEGYDEFEADDQLQTFEEVKEKRYL